MSNGNVLLADAPVWEVLLERYLRFSKRFLVMEAKHTSAEQQLAMQQSFIRQITEKVQELVNNNREYCGFGCPDVQNFGEELEQVDAKLWHSLCELHGLVTDKACMLRDQFCGSSLQSNTRVNNEPEICAVDEAVTDASIELFYQRNSTEIVSSTDSNATAFAEADRSRQKLNESTEQLVDRSGSSTESSIYSDSASNNEDQSEREKIDIFPQFSINLRTFLDLNSQY